MNLEKYLNDGTIIISKKEWELLKKDKEEVKDSLADLIVNKKISFPFPKIDYSRVRESFYNLENSKISFLTSDNIYYKFNYKYKLSKSYVEGLQSGIDCLKFYMEDIRVSTPVDGYSSPVQDWANKNKVKRMISPLWSFDIKEINNKTLFRAISLAKQIPSYFKPEIAKAIYENYNSKCILDISHGWGGRLLGAVTSKNTEAYIGIDPNIVVQDRLHCLIDDLSFSKDIELINDISENFYREESFDTVFSSIPYFSKERYIGDNQSYSNYKTFNSWMTSYLYPTLYNAWCSLKKDGVLIINVSNIKIRGIEYNICDPMNDFISDLYGAKEGTHFGVRIGIRPNTLVTKQKILCEPTWVWYKNK